MNRLAVALKEWAVVCHALACGRQQVLLRKGGIAEAGGGLFRPESPDFLLYPTYFHEQRAGVKPEYHDLFEEAEAGRPEPGMIRLTHACRVTRIEYLERPEQALALDPLHVWTAELVRQRFFYRSPGLHALYVETVRLPEPVVRPERPEYAGCKSWVWLDEPVSVGEPGLLGSPALVDEEPCS